MGSTRFAAVRRQSDSAPAGRRLVGVEAVIDKDLASALRAEDLHADALVIGSIADTPALLRGEAGTMVTTQ